MIKTERYAAKAVAIFLLAALSAPAAWAEGGPADVTDAQIGSYKSAMETGCRDAGRTRGDPPERVRSICRCMVQTLDTGMSRAEWQRAYFASSRGDPLGETQALAPHMSRTEACRTVLPAPSVMPDGKTP